MRRQRARRWAPLPRRRLCLIGSALRRALGSDICDARHRCPLRRVPSAAQSPGRRAAGPARARAGGLRRGVGAGGGRRARRRRGAERAAARAAGAAVGRVGRRAAAAQRARLRALAAFLLLLLLVGLPPPLLLVARHQLQQLRLPRRAWRLLNPTPMTESGLLIRLRSNPTLRKVPQQPDACWSTAARAHTLSDKAARVPAQAAAATTLLRLRSGCRGLPRVASPADIKGR